MDIGSAVPGMPAAAPMPNQTKTEYSASPLGAPTKPEEKAPESFGNTLNRMAGVTPEKSLYGEKKDVLSKDAYLKMMMEQLKYQDPFNPVKNEQFTQNMAMMSQLEQQINMNKTLDKMSQQNNNAQVTALQLVGKTIQADHAAIYHETGKFSPVKFTLPQDAKDLSVDVLGHDGQVLKNIPIGGKSQGEIETKWDGTLSEGMPAPSGKYSYRINAKDIEGKDISIPSKVDGRVTGVTNVQGVTFLLVGDQKVALNEVEVIKESPVDSAPKAAVVPMLPHLATAKAESKDEDDEGKISAGTKIATKVDVDEEATESLAERRPGLEKENLSDLMQVMFR